MTVPTNDYATAYRGRILSASHSANFELWRLFEDRPANWVDTILTELEYAVSHGYFGLAAEISDLLASTAADDLRDPPSRLIRFEMERMKRFLYIGFNRPAIASSRRIADLVEKSRTSLDTAEAALWQRTALGYEGWITTDAGHLDALVEECRRLQPAVPRETSIQNEALSFLHGLRGRAHALRGDQAATREAFREGLALLRPVDHPRTWGHMQVLLAEHLGMLGEWKEAVAAMWEFMDTAFAIQLRSHLFLRAVRFLLFLAPGELVTESQQRQLEFRWRVLVDGMGVNRSIPIMPFLSHSVSGNAAGIQWDVLSLDIRAELTRWLRTLDADGMETLVARVYRFLGYQVEHLDRGARALDLIAVQSSADGTRSAVGIQVKHWLSGPLSIADIPTEVSFNEMLRLIREAPDHVLPTSLHWYCSSGIGIEAGRLLDARARALLGEGCQVRKSKLDDLVTVMINRPELLHQLVMHVHVDRLFGSDWDGTH